MLDRVRGGLGLGLKIRAHSGDARHRRRDRRGQHDQRGHAGKPPRGRGDRHGGGNLIGRVAPRFLHRPAHRCFGVVSGEARPTARVVGLPHCPGSQPGVERGYQEASGAPHVVGETPAEKVGLPARPQHERRQHADRRPDQVVQHPELAELGRQHPAARREFRQEDEKRRYADDVKSVADAAKRHRQQAERDRDDDDLEQPTARPPIVTRRLLVGQPGSTRATQNPIKAAQDSSG